MSRVSADTTHRVTRSLMNGLCFSSPSSKKNLKDVTDSVCGELTVGHSTGSCRHPTETASDSHITSTDFLLMSVNVLVNVLSPTNCRTLQSVQRGIVENEELFKALVSLIGFPKQLISYLACKALVLFLRSARAVTEKMEYIINSSIQVNEDFKEDNKAESSFSQILATFDLIRLLCKQFHSQKSSQSVTSMCTCGSFIGENDHVVPFEGKFLEKMQSLSNFLEYFTFVFHKHFERDLNKVTLCIGNAKNDHEKLDLKEKMTPNWLEMLDSSEKHILFISYLKMTKSLLKRDKIQIVTINKVMHLLREVLSTGTKLQRTSVKLIFDIVTNFLKRKRQDKIDEILLQADTARNICSMFRSGAFWENIPCHDGPLGFGGVEFTEKSGDQKGDLVMLRKLANLYFVAVKVLLECETGHRTADFEVVAISLSTLSKYMSCKLKLDPAQVSESKWLCRLIIDADDDATVFILLTVLQIYIHLTELSDQDLQHQQLLSVSDIKEILSPHQLFWNYLKMSDFDQTLLLDLLMSSETDFLQYFTSYLHCMMSEWEHCGVVFRKMKTEERDSEERDSESDSEEDSPVSKRMKVEPGSINNFDSSNERQGTEMMDIKLVQLENSVKHELVVAISGQEAEKGSSCETFCENNDSDGVINPGLDQVLSVFIRLRMTLERLHQRKMFPYSISPLIRLLVEIEELYEK